ncbi:MAG: low-specificity L-threonine aldolase [Candidatus Marinimicrobia bacterium]|nr:low-specificity L-threonine aldolase [Candidatus Neomarinimicrobiota bacterium]
MKNIHIDLRSDTVTKPSPKMREAMFHAEVGDDVYSEDPTVNRLQERVAELLGKEESLFVPSGTMSNQVAIKTHTIPGQEVICEENCHIFNYEAGGPAFNSLVQLRTLRGKYGVLDVSEVEAAIRPDNVHVTPTALITLENTHNRAGGTIYPVEKMREIYALAYPKGIPMHLDGARLLNAVVATGIFAKEYSKYFDSVSICFSKGLGAPVGSVLAGSKEFINKARRYRKIFGGGMRQIGILAAACIYALDNNVERLAEDHKNASRLADGLRKLPGIYIDMAQVQTNMVMIHVRHLKFTPESLSRAILEKGLAALAIDSERIRAVTHLDISDEQIEEAIFIFQQVLKD